FFQAEDGIRDFHVTGVQTCALPISSRLAAALEAPPDRLLVYSIASSAPSRVSSLILDTTPTTDATAPAIAPAIPVTRLIAERMSLTEEVASLTDDATDDMDEVVLAPAEAAALPARPIASAVLSASFRT